jgi:hypothetical protein
MVEARTPWNKNNNKFKGKNNPNWKGDNISYDALHDWIQHNKPKRDRCEICHEKKPLDLANISGEYKRDVDDFQWLCRKCHMEKDGVSDKNRERNKIPWNKGKKTGVAPWNKGRKDVYSEETLKKLRRPKSEAHRINISKAMKGRTPWNKGSRRSC